MCELGFILPLFSAPVSVLFSASVLDLFPSLSVPKHVALILGAFKHHFVILMVKYTNVPKQMPMWVDTLFFKNIASLVKMFVFVVWSYWNSNSISLLLICWITFCLEYKTRLYSMVLKTDAFLLSSGNQGITFKALSRTPPYLSLQFFHLSI